MKYGGTWPKPRSLLRPKYPEGTRVGLINLFLTYVLSEEWTLTHCKAILLQMESSFATRHRFLLTRDKTDRLFVSQKRKMANKTSSGNVFKFMTHLASLWFDGIEENQRRTTRNQPLLKQRLRCISHAKESK